MKAHGSAEAARQECPAGGIPAVLRLVTGEREGRVLHLTERSARVRLANPPAGGAPVLLCWRRREVSSRVVWSTGDMCELAFEKPIPRSELFDAPGGAARPRPAAGLGNIPLGQKRQVRRG